MNLKELRNFRSEVDELNIYELTYDADTEEEEELLEIYEEIAEKVRELEQKTDALIEKREEANRRRKERRKAS